MSNLTLTWLCALLTLHGSRPAQSASTQADLDDYTAACLTDDPYFVTTRLHGPGAPLAPAVLAFRWQPGLDSPVVLARQRDVGATYGVAVDDRRADVFVGAYLKRGAPLGPAGPGAIYRIDLEHGGVSPWAQVPGAGPDPHDAEHFPDRRAADAVGRTGLGDLDVDAEERWLFAVNLRDQRIHRFDLETARWETAFDVGSLSEDWREDGRPFGLLGTRIWLYHGVVRDPGPDGDPSELRAVVYRSDFTGQGMTQVLDAPLATSGGRIDGLLDGRLPTLWGPWRDGYRTIDPLRRLGVDPQPMLADLELSDAGELLVGLRDRNGDRTYRRWFEADPDRNPDFPELPAGEQPGMPAGDVLLARPGGRAGWRIEAGEHFRQDVGPGGGSRLHAEIAYGGLARVLVRDWAVTSAMMPDRGVSAGALWLDDPTGITERRKTLYAQSQAWAFDHVGGLGDVERLCPVPPIRVPTRPPPRTVAPPSPTVTATRTPRPTPTPTATTLPTSTASVTPSPSPRPSLTITPTATATQTPSPSPTWTAQPSGTPSPTPSPSPTQRPSRTPSPSPTATSTALPSPTATPRPTPSVYHAWLPWSGRADRCFTKREWADVALVLDRSTSMRRSVVEGGISKDEAALSAARDFVLRLDTSPNRAGRQDRVAIVGFNDRAWTQQALGTGLVDALAGVEGLRGTLAHGTRLDLALHEGRAALSSRETTGNRPVLILLTDGLPNRVPFPQGGRQEDTVLAQAEAARSVGITVYTIGLGAPGDVSDTLLTDIAGDPQRYYRAPEAGDLARIYAAIAVAIRICR